MYAQSFFTFRGLRRAATQFALVLAVTFVLGTVATLLLLVFATKFTAVYGQPRFERLALLGGYLVVPLFLIAALVLRVRDRNRKFVAREVTVRDAYLKDSNGGESRILWLRACELGEVQLLCEWDSGAPAPESGERVRVWLPREPLEPGERYLLWGVEQFR